MSVLFIAKYKPGVVSKFGTTPVDAKGKPSDSGQEPRKQARAQAIKLFGFPQGQEVAQIDSWQFKSSFLVDSTPGANAHGWVAVIPDAEFQTVMDTIGWPNGPICLMYDITIIPLAAVPGSDDVYANMTPKDWDD